MNKKELELELDIFIKDLSNKTLELISIAQDLGIDFRVEKINNSLYFSLDIPTDSWYSHTTLQLCLDKSDDINIIIDRKEVYEEMIYYLNEIKEEKNVEERRREIISNIKSKLSADELRILGI